MGKLSFGDILKPFYQGDLQGKKRYLRITKKIKAKEPFQLVTGESVVLESVSYTHLTLQTTPYV